VLRPALDRRIYRPLKSVPAIGTGLKVMPAFVECPTEAASISRILAGYGELEFLLCRALGKPLGTIEAGIKALFRKRTTEKERIAIAKGYLRPYYAGKGLDAEAEEAFRAVDWCRITRNTFAHAAARSRRRSRPAGDGGIGRAPNSSN
jgi:hypothetical protein